MHASSFVHRNSRERHPSSDNWFFFDSLYWLRSAYSNRFQQKWESIGPWIPWLGGLWTSPRRTTTKFVHNWQNNGSAGCRRLPLLEVSWRFSGAGETDPTSGHTLVDEAVHSKRHPSACTLSSRHSHIVQQYFCNDRSQISQRSEHDSSTKRYGRTKIIRLKSYGV